MESNFSLTPVQRTRGKIGLQYGFGSEVAPVSEVAPGRCTAAAVNKGIWPPQESQQQKDGETELCFKYLFKSPAK
jgi:hypothetical protein